MEKKLSYCGFNCATCIIYIETKMNNFDEIRKLMYNADESETIETLGCKGCPDKFPHFQAPEPSWYRPSSSMHYRKRYLLPLMSF